MCNLRFCVPMCCLMTLMSGCGGDEDFGLGQVTGTVTCEGKAVTQGAVSFTPVVSGENAMVGKPAMGKIEPDGSFRLTTYVQHDGAVVGKHRVTVTFPGEELRAIPGDEDDENGGVADGLDSRPRRSNVKLPPCAGSKKKIEVEVVSGENSFEIELDE